ncbi:MAG: DUF2277 family protein [Gammaproteobacteria bacterium]
MPVDRVFRVLAKVGAGFVLQSIHGGFPGKQRATLAYGRGLRRPPAGGRRRAQAQALQPLCGLGRGCDHCNENRAATGQFVRKIRGSAKPPGTSAAVFDRAAEDIEATKNRLLAARVTNAPPKEHKSRRGVIPDAQCAPV